MEEVEEGWVELPIVPEVPIYSQESRKDETQSESKTSKTAGRGGPVSVLLGARCAVVLEEVGVLVMPWRACRSALAALRMKSNGGSYGEQKLSYAIQYARGDTLLPTTSLGTVNSVRIKQAHHPLCGALTMDPILYRPKAVPVLGSIPSLHITPRSTTSMPHVIVI